MQCQVKFLSTLSLRRATHYDNYNLHCVEISIHALLAESDGGVLLSFFVRITFLSTLSLRRATHKTKNNCIDCCISIHALLAESDPLKSESLTTYFISIHALLAESDYYGCYSLRHSASFLSTLSLRRATWPPVRDIIQWEDFYPRSPCGERHR